MGRKIPHYWPSNAAGYFEGDWKQYWTDLAGVTLGYGIGLGLLLSLFMFARYIQLLFIRKLEGKRRERQYVLYRNGALTLCVISVAIFIAITILGGMLSGDVDDVLVRLSISSCAKNNIIVS